MQEYKKIKIISTLIDTSNYTLYVALDGKQKNLILKTVKKLNFNLPAYKHLVNELSILNNLDSKYIVKAYDLVETPVGLALILEKIDGISLRKFIDNQKISSKYSIDYKINIAIKIAKGLLEIGNKDIIHSDLKPDNIIINPVKSEIKIIDFGLASQFVNQSTEIYNQTWVGTPAYTSPEQTGKIQTTIDYRTDFYSFGLILYELFTGTYPFKASSTREYLHAHLTQMPVFMSFVNSSIPNEISAIVDKLLAKSPADRYLSANGIIKDLEYAKDFFSHESFERNWLPGQYDIPQKLHFQEKIFGRDTEIKRLKEAMLLLENGNPISLFISGEPGIGKTSLINEIYRLTVQKDYIVISGKFNKLEKDIPYSAIHLAFSRFFKLLIGDLEIHFNRIRDKLLKNLDNNGQLIIDIIPELELIIGKQITPPKLNPQENQNRFDYTFQNFLQSFASYEMPLLLIFDDIQWADRASLEAINTMLKSNSSSYMMFIASYRKNELTENKSLARLKEELDKNPQYNFTLFLQGLDIHSTADFLSNLLYRPLSIEEEIVKTIQGRTLGNPFFLRELILNLYEKKLIYYDTQKVLWGCNLKEILKLQSSDSVADLVAKRITKLPQKTQDVLKVCSCLGFSFDIADIEILVSQSLDQIKEALIPALKNNLIISIIKENSNTSYSFIHERIINALYYDFDEEDKINTHLKIALNLLNKYKNNPSYIFDLVKHFNISLPKLSDLKLIEKNFYLNIEVALKSKNAGALDTALEHFRISLNLLNQFNLEVDKDKRFLLFKNYATIAQLLGKFELMNRIIAEALYLADTEIKKAEFLKIEIYASIAQYKQNETLTKAKKLLKLLGVNLPAKSSQAIVGFELIKILVLLRKYKHSQILESSFIQDEKLKMAMEIMGALVTTLYRADPNLFPLIVFKMISITLGYGLSPVSAVGFIAYGVLVNGLFGNIDKGIAYAYLGLAISKKFPNNIFEAQVKYLFYIAHYTWENEFKECINQLSEVYKLALRLGDFEYAVSAAIGIAHISFIKGDNLKDNYNLINNYKSFLVQLNQEITLSQIDLVLSCNHNLQEATENQDILVNSFYDENKMIQKHELENDGTSLVNIYIDKLFLAIIFDKKRNALVLTQKAAKYVAGLMGLYAQYDYFFYDSIARFRAWELLSASQKRKSKKKIKKNGLKLKKASQRKAENFAAKFYVVSAINKQIDNKIVEAGKDFEKAILEAGSTNMMSVQAIAYELAAELNQKVNNPSIHDFYLNRAYIAYSLWGAHAKAELLKQQFPAIIQTENNSLLEKNASSRKSSSLSSYTSKMEFLAESFKIISGEIVFDKLLEKTMTIILEHVGADTGILLLRNKKNGEMEIVAQGDIINHKISIEIKQKELNNKNIPDGIIRYVEKLNTQIIIKDAVNNSLYARDEYIKAHHVHSVLSLPIRYKSILKGVLYLENKVLSNVFSEDNLQLLEILITQLAISIENVNMYEHLDEQVKNRTNEIIKQKEIIELKQKAITESITYAGRIQNALLPRNISESSVFKDYFIFYRPRDIVSGDFYWYKNTSKREVFVAADCTGHGVPGAFMSLLGISILKEKFTDNFNFSAADLLNDMRQNIKTAISSRDKIGDGIDLALLIIDKKSLIVNFAGAYSSLVIVRNRNFSQVEGHDINKQIENENFILYNISGDIQPVGSHILEKPFTNKRVQLHPQDLIFLYSDGFADQIGGKQERKYTKLKLKKILLQNSKKSLSSQQKLLIHEFDNWKKNSKQIDDVLVVGLKIGN